MQKYQGLPPTRNKNLQCYKLPGDLFVHESVRGPRLLLFFPSILKCTAGVWLLSCAMEWPIQNNTRLSPAFLSGDDNSCLLICQKEGSQISGQRSSQEFVPNRKFSSKRATNTSPTCRIFKFISQTQSWKNTCIFFLYLKAIMLNEKIQVPGYN